MPRDDEHLGTIEELTESAHRDLAIRAFREVEGNAPVFDPERRRFLTNAARIIGGGLATAYYLGFPLPSNAKDSDFFRPSSQTNRFVIRPDWKSSMLRADQVYGPPTLISGINGLPNDHANHILNSPFSPPAGGFDWDVPSKIPVVPATSGKVFVGIRKSIAGIRKVTGSKVGFVYTQDRDTLYASVHAHLDAFNEASVDFSAEGLENLPRIELTQILGTVGSSGTSVVHLHYGLFKKGRRNRRWTEVERPGIDPQTTGPYGGRQVFYDGTTNVEHITHDFNNTAHLKAIFLKDELKKRGADELGIDTATYNALLDAVDPTDLGSLQRFLRHEVLQKHEGKDGRHNYKYLPGHPMYGLTLKYAPRPESGVMTLLPFISPQVVEHYREANPGLG